MLHSKTKIFMQCNILYIYTISQLSTTLWNIDFPDESVAREWRREGCGMVGAVPGIAATSSMVDHASLVKTETGYECVNMEVLMAEMHGC